ncbi:hypothetical protein [Alkalihalobacillus sp. 1P02AB]|uniref:hypothetical protein n=1 Tax=Alkalihalobacillus sp. 1P02AB TaxID=3132260 RepID=UPI0039A50E68
MNCQACGKELTNADKFCIHCGEKVGESLISDSAAKVETEPTKKETAAAIEAVHPTQAPTSGGTTEANKGQNEKVEQAKKTASDYFQFITKQLKAPTETAIKYEKSNFIFGYINFALISLFFALASYFQFSSLARGFLSAGDFFELFFQAFFSIAVILVATAALLFAVLKFVYKIDLKFHDIVSQYGTWLSIPVYIAAAYFLSSAIGLNVLTSLIVVLLLSLLVAVVALTFFYYRQQMSKGIDPIYGLLIVFAGVAVILALTADFILSGLMRAIF